MQTIFKLLPFFLLHTGHVLAAPVNFNSNPSQVSAESPVAVVTSVVYVNQNGEVVEGYTPAATQSASNPSSVAAATPAAAAATTTAAAAAAPTAAGSLGNAITFSPYNGDGTCMSTSDVASKVQIILGAGYDTIRLYGVDCNQVSNVLAAIEGTSIKLMVGVFDPSSYQSELQTLISAMSGNWDKVVLVGLLNEAVNDGKITAAEAVTVYNTGKSMLQSAGYTGYVGVVDTFIAILNNPEMCNAMDIVTANCHAWFAGVEASTAGSYVNQQVAALQAKCGKQVWITETGWPSEGGSNSLAVASEATQQQAISSLASVSNKFLFSAFNDLWKTGDLEQHWGILN